MAIKIGSNLAFQGQQPNFERDRFATKAAMKAFPETSIDDGHLSYCAEDGNTYQFKSSNSVDAVTGKWRVFKADVDLSAYATKDSVNSELNKKVNIRGISKYNSMEGKAAYLKVITIAMSKTRNTTGLLELLMTSRTAERIDVIVTMDNIPEIPIINVVEITYRTSINLTPVYYYTDLTGEVPIITLYFKLTAYDTATVKVVDKDAYMPFTYTLNMEVVQTLPEGVIQVHHINYGNKNLFYATPKDGSGDPKFRAIDITDLPDLSSKYATKEKAFTKDIVSTEPGQVVAGPATTQGNLYLRKLLAYDIPDLKSKYQAITASGYQESPKILNAIVRNNSDDVKSFIKASISEASSGKNSPDWYFATDGSLQDITASYYKKAYLDDKLKVISASLNDLASKTYDDTEVRQLISNNTSAIGTKADKSELSRYQPKYNADYIATSDISTLPITTGVIDLNGNQIDLPNIDLVDGYLTIMNGTVVFNATTTNLRVKELELSNVTISYSDDVNIVLDIQKLKCLNVVDNPGQRVNFITEGFAIKQATLINSFIRSALPIAQSLEVYSSTCNINGNVKLTAYNSFVGENGLSLANGSAWYNTQLDISPYYTSGWVDETGKMHCGMYFDDTITGDSDYAPQTKAVYNALQVKADKTQLASLATQTDFVELRNKVNAMPKTVFITQAAYDALTTKDPNTIYYING